MPHTSNDLIWWVVQGLVGTLAITVGILLRGFQGRLSNIEQDIKVLRDVQGQRMERFVALEARAGEIYGRLAHIEEKLDRLIVHLSWRGCPLGQDRGAEDPPSEGRRS